MSQTDVPTRDQPDQGSSAPARVDGRGDSVLDGRDVGRRTLMKGIGASAAGAYALGSDYGMVDESEAAVATLAIGGAILAGAALGYVAGEVADHYIGAGTGDLTGAEEDQDLYTSLKSRMVEMEAANDTVLTTMSNRVEDSRNIAWAKGKKAAVNALNNGDTETAAKDAAVAEIDAYYSVMQKNLLNRFTEVANKTADVVGLAAGNSNVAPKYVLQGTYSGSTTDGTSHLTAGSHSTTLADGTSYTFNRYLIPDGTYPNGSGLAFDPVNGVDDMGNLDSYVLLRIDPWDTGESVEPLKPSRWVNLWTAISDAVTQMRTNIKDYCTTLYANYSAGDIDASKFVDPTTLASELSTDYGSTGYHAYAAAEAAVLGVPGNFDHALTLELQDTGITVQGSLWTDWAPESFDDSTTSTSTDSTTSTETTTSTSTASGFNTGTVYDPANTAKDVYVSFEYTGPDYIEGADVFTKDSDGNFTKDGNVTNQSSLESVESEYVQVYFGTLTEPFAITGATNTETGETVNEVNLESKNNQTSDVSLTQEQLTLLSDIRTELRENENTGGGGGFNVDQFSFGGIPGEGVLLAGAGVLAYLMGK